MTQLVQFYQVICPYVTWVTAIAAVFILPLLGAALGAKINEVEFEALPRFVLGLCLIACVGVIHWFIWHQASWAVFTAGFIFAGFAFWEGVLFWGNPHRHRAHSHLGGSH